MSKNKKTKIQSRDIPHNYSRQRYFIFFFAFLVLYNFIVVNKFHIWQADVITISYHLVDFSFGFCTKLLPGAIYNFFFPKVIDWQVTAYETALLLLFFVFLAYTLAGKVTAYRDYEARKTMLILCMFYISGACTFAAFTYELGMLDTYWVFLAAVFLAAMKNKYFKFTVPVICVLSILVHFGSLPSYIVFFMLILLYEISAAKTTSSRIQLLAIFAVSLLTIGVCSVYFVTHEQSNLVYTMEEFDSIIKDRSRYLSENANYFAYYNYALYRDFPSGLSEQTQQFAASLDARLPAFLANAIRTLIDQIGTIRTYTEDNNLLDGRIIQFLILSALLLPILVFLYGFWIHKIKTTEKNFLKRLVFFLTMVQFPFTLFVSFLFSDDVVRWYTHAFLVHSTIFLYVLSKENDMPYVKNRIKQYNPHLLFLYYLAYALLMIAPY